VSSHTSDDRLRHIRSSIMYIEQFTADGEAAFRASRMIQHAVLYNLLVIGEASRALAIEVRQQLPEVEWKRIIGLRNILTHEYYSVDLDIIWGIISRRLHELRDQIDRFLSR